MSKRTHALALAAIAAAVLAFGGATPAAAQPESVLRVVLINELGSLDPVQSTAAFVRNHGFMVYDTLFAVDPDFRVQPQMVEGHEVSGDGRTWRFRLREGLKFHDDQPVRGVDCVASIRRWGARDTMGQTLMLAADELRATSDRDFEIRLKRPFPLMLDALGKLSTQALFVVP